MKGEGSSEKPFLIECTNDYHEFAGLDQNTFYFRLESDLDFRNDVILVMQEFYGVLDGNGHNIFSTRHPLMIRNRGQVSNLNIIDCSIQHLTDDNIGAICDVNIGSIHHCTVSGQINGGSWVGGITGQNYGPIQFCSVSADISGGSFIGGVVGSNYGYEGYINECYTTGNVHGTRSVGRIAGYSSGRIIDCFATGRITGENHVGTICGQSHAPHSIIECRVPNIIIRGPAW